MQGVSFMQMELTRRTLTMHAQGQKVMCAVIILVTREFANDVTVRYQQIQPPQSVQTP